MLHANLELLRHIQEEVPFILRHTTAKEELINDQILRRTVIRSLEIIGEASKKLNDEFKAIHSDIEWKKNLSYQR